MSGLTKVQWDNLGKDFLDSSVDYYTLDTLPIEVYHQVIWDNIVETNSWTGERIMSNTYLINKLSNKQIIDYYHKITKLENEVIESKVSFYLDDNLGLVIEHR
ncbi:MAG: hypothetical protein EBT86_01055 [Actinobacteria bacterium]|nr:hypothetical protein [Actinomycetota bacterium]